MTVVTKKIPSEAFSGTAANSSLLQEKRFFPTLKLNASNPFLSELKKEGTCIEIISSTKIERSALFLRRSGGNQENLNITADGVGYVATDVTGLPRNGAGFVYAILNKTPDPSLGLSGLAGSILVLTGGVALERGRKAAVKAYRVEDKTGIVSSSILLSRGGVEAATGAVLAPMRALNFAAAKTASKTVQTAAGVFSGMANGLNILLYTLLAIPFLINGAGAISLTKALKKKLAEGDKNAQFIEFFTEKIGLSKEDRSELLKKFLEKDPDSIKPDHELMQNSKVISLLDDEVGALLDKVIRRSGDVKSKMKELEKMKRLFKAELERALEKKENSVRRAIGDNALDAVKEHILSSPKVQKEKIDEVIAKVEQSARATKIFALVIVLFSIISITAAILSFPIGGPAILGIIAAGMWLAASLGWAAVDFYAAYEDFKKGLVGKWDKIALIAISAVMALSIALTTALTGGLVGFLLGLGMGAIWLGGSSYYYYKMRQKLHLLEKNQAPALNFNRLRRGGIAVI